MDAVKLWEIFWVSYITYLEHQFDKAKRGYEANFMVLRFSCGIGGISSIGYKSIFSNFHETLSFKLCCFGDSHATIAMLKTLFKIIICKYSTERLNCMFKYYLHIETGIATFARYMFLQSLEYYWHQITSRDVTSVWTTIRAKPAWSVDTLFVASQ